MAYVDFRMAELSGGEAVSPPLSGHFSALEWLVIALAERDRLSSLRQPGRFARAAAALFGGRDERPLAGPRLEALRRLAVLVWHRGANVPAAELAAFVGAGFSSHQARALIDSITGRRSGRPA